MPHDGAVVNQVFESDDIDVYRIVLPSLSSAAQTNSSQSLFFSGFRNFLTPWLVKTKTFDALVDVGPAITVPALRKALQDLGVAEGGRGNRELLILLTHIHIDHAGGLGDFIEAFPDAKIMAHPSGRAHLVSPEKLWDGSIRTLGDLVYAYGPIKPVPEKNILSHEEQSGRRNGASGAAKGENDRDRTGESQVSVAFEGLEVIPTPGHASHHQSYVISAGGTRVLFLGEAAGIYDPDFDYLRPATPPRFFYDVYVRSLLSLTQVDPSIMCYGHYGYSKDKSLLTDELNQLDLWRKVVSRELSHGRCGKTDPAGTGDKSRERSSDSITGETLFRILSEDRFLNAFPSLAPDIAAREKYFLENSIKGFMGYLAKS